MGGLKLSGRLLRGVKFVGEAWQTETDIWARFPMSIVDFLVLVFDFPLLFEYFLRLRCLRILQGKPWLGGTQGDAL